MRLLAIVGWLSAILVLTLACWEPGPEIQVSGPDRLAVGVTGYYSAEARGCQPAPNGWAWEPHSPHSGGGPSYSRAWTVRGVKMVCAENYGCPGVRGCVRVVVYPQGVPE